MFSVRNRLLILLVLVSVVTAAAWSPAYARKAKSSTPPSWTTVGSHRPSFGPTSGEPDVGQGPKPSKGTGCVPITQPPTDVPDPTTSLPRWYLRIWISTLLGAR
jgi:hypothetical protein